MIGFFTGYRTPASIFGAHVYIERITENEIVFDFFDSNSFSLFATSTQLPDDWEERGSIIVIKNYHGKRIQEGVVYTLTDNFLDQVSIEEFDRVEDSFVLAYRLDVNAFDGEVFGRSVSLALLSKYYAGVVHFTRRSLDEFRYTNTTSKILIRKIGQGSWNELYSGDTVHTVFDIGTIYSTSRTKLMSLYGNRDSVYQKSKPVVIVSHWDVDHYHFLLVASDETIKSIPYFIFRNKVPTLTARKVIGRFQKLNSTALFPVNPEIRKRYSRGPGKLKEFALNDSKSLLLYNGQNVRSRNKSGMGLVYRSKKKSVVFAADLNYDQVDNSILPRLNYEHAHFLVVPHHGGNAGKMVYNLINGIVPNDAVISVGPNPYSPKHPRQKNIDELRKVGFRVRRTDRSRSDIQIQV